MALPLSSPCQGASQATDTTTVTVTGARKTVSQTLDRKIYRIDQDIEASHGTAADALKTVPSVEIDPDGQVSLRGDSKVIVLIDGKPSAQTSGASGGDGLSQLSADDIAQIEVINNPPAQYGAEGAAGVINIVTKHARKPGLNRSTTLSLGNRRYTSSLSGAWRQDKLSFSGGLSLRQEDRHRRIRVSRASRVEEAPAFTSTTHSQKEQQTRQIPGANFTAGFTPTDGQELTFKISHVERAGHRSFDQFDNSVSPNGALTSASKRHSDGRDWRLDAAQSLTYARNLSHDGETLTMAVQRSVVREREHYVYTNTYSLPVAPASHDRLNLGLDLFTTEWTLDYVRPLKDAMLSAGLVFHSDDNGYNNSGDTIDEVTGLPVVDPNITNDFSYRQTIAGLYVSYRRTVGAWEAQGGLRLEQAQVHTLQVAGHLNNASQHTELYPSLHLRRTLGEGRHISLSYGRRVSRPDPEELNPFSDHQDTRNLRAGNPNLRPQLTQSFEVGYSRDMGRPNWSLIGYARFNTDAVTEVAQVLSPDVILVTKANLPRSRAIGMEFSVNGALGSKLTYATSGNLFDNQIDATALGIAGLRSSTGLNLKGSLDYKMSAHDTAQVSFSRSDKRLTPQGDISAYNLVNFGYRHQVSPQLSLFVTVSDAFRGQKTVRTIITPTLHDTYEREVPGATAFFGLTYTPGGPKKDKVGFEYDQGG